MTPSHTDPIVFRCRLELAAWLRDSLPEEGGLIVVDGAMGAGKSTLARYLAHSLDGEWAPCDCFEGDMTRESYCEQRNHPRLSQWLEVAAQRTRATIVDAFTALDVLERLERAEDCWIFVDRFFVNTNTGDELRNDGVALFPHLYPSAPERVRTLPPSPKLREARNYNARRDPLSKANALFKVVRNNPEGGETGIPEG